MTKSAVFHPAPRARNPFALGRRSAEAPRRSLRSLALGSLFVSSVLGLACAPAGAVNAPPVPGQQLEGRIQEMHAKLQITPAQEELWTPVAQTMRDNQRTLEPLVAEREKNAKTANALEDLRSFAEVSEAHASGIRRFAAAFEPLYSAMTDAQRQGADALFRDGAGRMGKSR
jgi:hypothetical protein